MHAISVIGAFVVVGVALYVIVGGLAHDWSTFVRACAANYPVKASRI